MNTKSLTTLLGLTVALVSNIVLPAEGKLRYYQETGGRENFAFDSAGLAALEEVGLTLESFTSTDTPPPGYEESLRFLTPSEDPVRSNWFFVYDEETGFYEDLGPDGVFLGAATFSVDQTKLDLPPLLEVGDFAITIHPNESPNPFPPEVIHVTDESGDIGVTLFTSVALSFPEIDLENRTWFLEPLDVLIHEEFSNFLLEAGATESLEGVRIATASAERVFVEVSVPEPSSIIGLISVGSFLLLKKTKRD